MHIAEAAKHLANLLSDHYEEQNSKDPAILFLAQVARIQSFRDGGNLSEWESAVLSVFDDHEWEIFENRNDFSILESIWEIGRINLYGAINEAETKKLYHVTANKILDITGQPPLSIDTFDFSVW